jgi:NAD(P)-dependent dehydrogenase (short-subunit alcohol dehydrogenase family)
MKNKIVLITGATGGIGKAAAIGLAKQGAHMILHGRNPKKTEEVKQEIIRLTGNQQIDIITADLFLMTEVKKMAAAISGKYPVIDVLINNAGIMMGKTREETAEGIEKTTALNMVAPYLLTTLLLPNLQKSKSARVINVSSSAHQQNAKPDFGDLVSERKYSPLTVYGNTKLFMIMVSRQWVVKLKEAKIDNVTVNSMHPGAVATNFSVESDLGGFLNFLGKIARVFFRSPEKGAETILYLASSQKGVTGDYFVDCKPASVSQKYATSENEKTVFSWCEKITGTKFAANKV